MVNELGFFNVEDIKPAVYLPRLLAGRLHLPVPPSRKVWKAEIPVPSPLVHAACERISLLCSPSTAASLLGNVQTSPGHVTFEYQPQSLY